MMGIVIQPRAGGFVSFTDPSRALTATTLTIVAVGSALPATPLAAPLGFTRLPAAYLAFLVVATMGYLGMVEIAKRQLTRRAARWRARNASTALSSTLVKHIPAR